MDMVQPCIRYDLGVCGNFLLSGGCGDFGRVCYDKVERQRLECKDRYHDDQGRYKLEGYLGRFAVDIKNTPYADYTDKDWAMLFIEKYGQIDGAHHKAWVLDQVARILQGTPVVVEERRWKNGTREYDFDLAEPSKEYKKWVTEMLGKYDHELQEYEYDYDEGTAP
jgi:hypothetical protein